MVHVCLTFGSRSCVYIQVTAALANSVREPNHVLTRSLTRGGHEPSEVVFSYIPDSPRFGNAYCTDRCFGIRDMQYNFHIVQVSGQVRWKYQGPSAGEVTLKLKRVKGKGRSEQVLGELEAAKFVPEPSNDGFITQQFCHDIGDPLSQFWKKGAKGKLLIACRANWTHFLPQQ